MEKELLSMIKTFDFYFDFSSPYTYLAHKEIQKIEIENSIKINYKPILLGGILKLAGIKANVDIPIKGKYMIRDCKLISKKKKINFIFNSNFPIMTLNLMRFVLIAEKMGFAKKFIKKIFESIWSDDLNLNDQIVVKKILNSFDINIQNFLNESSQLIIKNELKKRTDEAHKKGVFGVPTFIVNNKLFWGQDRLEFALEEAKI